MKSSIGESQGSSPSRRVVTRYECAPWQERRKEGCSRIDRRALSGAGKEERAVHCLLHHVTPDLLWSYEALKKDAVDGVTWCEYETGLDDRLIDLHRGAYRAQPSAESTFRRLTEGNDRSEWRRWRTRSFSQGVRPCQSRRDDQVRRASNSRQPNATADPEMAGAGVSEDGE